MTQLPGTYNLVKYGYQYKNKNEFKPISDWYSGQIHHSITHSVRPEYVEQKLVRDFRLEGSELVTEFENTDEFIKFARWKKI